MVLSGQLDRGTNRVSEPITEISEIQHLIGGDWLASADGERFRDA